MMDRSAEEPTAYKVGASLSALAAVVAPADPRCPTPRRSSAPARTSASSASTSSAPARTRCSRASRSPSSLARPCATSSTRSQSTRPGAFAHLFLCRPVPPPYPPLVSSTLTNARLLACTQRRGAHDDPPALLSSASASAASPGSDACPGPVLTTCLRHLSITMHPSPRSERSFRGQGHEEGKVMGVHYKDGARASLRPS